MSKTKSVLKTKSEEFQNKVKNSPLLPGCYLYKDESGENIYIGKAKHIRKRVKSYFSNYPRLDPRIQQMVDTAVDIEFITVDSEVEALVLETNLIKKYDPKYNIMMRDDKSFVYVKFDKIKASKDENDWKPVPTIKVVRDRTLDKDADYFGPYPESRTVRRLRRIYPYCTSKNQVWIPKKKSELIISKTKKPCFQHHIELCPGICAGKVTRSEYEASFRDLKKFFQSQKTSLLAELQGRMKLAADAKNYETAAKLRDRIRDLQYVGQNIRVDKDTDDVAIMQAKKERREQALSQLIERLQFPPEHLKQHKGFKIECYDISNIQGTNAVGSMVVFVNGEPKPQLYRRFKIRMKNEPNDFAMLQEVLTRRFNQYLKSQVNKNNQLTQPSPTKPWLSRDIEGFEVEIPKDLQQKMKNWQPDESFSVLPDLMIIDGGKGQLSSTFKILQSYRLDKIVPIVGLAKREEEIFKVVSQFKDEIETEFDPTKHQKLSYVPVDKIDEFDMVRLPKKSEALYLVQRIRDEAHRFAITYHRNLRSKQMKKIIEKSSD